MNGWLVFFAFPISTIILSITAQKLIKSPILVASVFFAIYLIAAFAVFSAFFIVYAFVYSIFAYITAIMTQMVIQFIQNNKNIVNNFTSNFTNNASNLSNNSNMNTNGIENTGGTTNIRVRITPRNGCCNRSCRYR